MLKEIKEWFKKPEKVGRVVISFLKTFYMFLDFMSVVAFFAPFMFEYSLVKSVHFGFVGIGLLVISVHYRGFVEKEKEFWREIIEGSENGGGF